ncbi:hypothetical protein PFISCL1PPCAC_6530, partial [Pristionchus fissidentatus]
IRGQLSFNEAQHEFRSRSRKEMKSLHRGVLLDTSILFTVISCILPFSEAFFLPMTNCGGCQSIPLCCNFPSFMQQQQQSGFGSQLFSSYGVGRTFPAAPTGYATAPAAYPAAQAGHPWALHIQNHYAATQTHLNNHEAQYQMPAYPSIPSPPQPTYTYQSGSPE